MARLLGVFSLLLTLPLTSFSQVNFNPPIGNAIQFPDTPVGRVSSIAYTATNAGNDMAIINFNFNNAQFSAVPNQLQLGAGQQGNFELRFSPQQAGVINGTMTLSIRQGDLGAIRRVNLSGRGIEGQPEIAVEPQSIELSVWVDFLGNIWEETSATLLVSNTGAQVLNVESIQGIPQWLSVRPTRFQVAAGAQQEVSVEVPREQWEAMEPDTYRATLTIISNAVNNDRLAVTVTFERGFIPHYLILLPEEDLSSHIIAVAYAAIGEEELEVWDEVGIWTPREVLSGRGHLEAPDEWPIFCIAWGEGDEFEGFREGDPFLFTLWDHDQGREYAAEVEWLEGPERFENEGVSMVTLFGVEPPTRHQVPLLRGWQLMSLPLRFSDNYLENGEPSLRLIFQPIQDNILIVKDSRGRFYIPRLGFNNIPSWNALEGYQIKLSQNDTLEVEGTRLPVQTEIALPSGWSMVAYLPDISLTLSEALRELVIQEVLIIAKKGNGQFYTPRWGVGGNVVVNPWEGLQVKLSSPARFHYPSPQGSPLFLNDNPGIQAQNQPRHFIPPSPTDNNMSLVIASWEGEEWIEGGELGCITPRSTVGGAILTENDLPWGMAVWGDDALTEEEIEGFRTGEELRFLYWDPESDREHPVTFEVVEGGEPIYQPNGILVLGMTLSTPLPNNLLPTAFTVQGPYPNPFNSSTLWTIYLPFTAPISVKVMNLKGQMVMEETLTPARPGVLEWRLRGDLLPAGLYLLVFQYHKNSLVKKALLIR